MWPLVQRELIHDHVAIGLVSALAEMYVQGVSTRKVKPSLKSCADTHSARARSATSTKRSTSNWRQFSMRRLDEDYPYLILDAQYERVRENGTIHKSAVLVAIGINWDGAAVCAGRA